MLFIETLVDCLLQQEWVYRFLIRIISVVRGVDYALILFFKDVNFIHFVFSFLYIIGIK